MTRKKKRLGPQLKDVIRNFVFFFLFPHISYYLFTSKVAYTLNTMYKRLGPQLLYTDREIHVELHIKGHKEQM